MTKIPRQLEQGAVGAACACWRPFVWGANKAAAVSHLERKRQPDRTGHGCIRPRAEACDRSPAQRMPVESDDAASSNPATRRFSLPIFTHIAPLRSRTSSESSQLDQEGVPPPPTSTPVSPIIGQVSNVFARDRQGQLLRGPSLSRSTSLPPPRTHSVSESSGLSLYDLGGC